MDFTLLFPAAKAIWAGTKQLFLSELEAKIGTLPPDIQAGISAIEDSLGEAIVAGILQDQLQAAAADPARADRVKQIKEEIAKRNS